MNKHVEAGLRAAINRLDSRLSIRAAIFGDKCFVLKEVFELCANGIVTRGAGICFQSVSGIGVELFERVSHRKFSLHISDLRLGQKSAQRKMFKRNSRALPNRHAMRFGSDKLVQLTQLMDSELALDYRSLLHRGGITEKKWGRSTAFGSLISRVF
jgi:hypothetical protein